jgi:hypothetical protein
MKRQQQRGPQTITVETLINVLRQLEPQSRLGILLGGLVATVDELGFPEAELVRVVRVASVQRAIAMQVQKDRSLVNAAGQPVMPTGPIDLARAIPWRCPLCDSEVPAGVKHKHTASEWMTGKRVAMATGQCGWCLAEPGTPHHERCKFTGIVPELGREHSAFNGADRPMTPLREFQEPDAEQQRPADDCAFCPEGECERRDEPPGVPPSDEPPTVDESTPGAPRGAGSAGDPYERAYRDSLVCDECGDANGHAPSCSQFTGV